MALFSTMQSPTSEFFLCHVCAETRTNKAAVVAVQLQKVRRLGDAGVGTFRIVRTASGGASLMPAWCSRRLPTQMLCSRERQPTTYLTSYKV